ncbi:MAG: 50S ribosomal protein L2 [Candidatus Micrarchaeota archaeon]|nr:50S ribosomal protein L2 [Candidatus Micrarchaeota archaeon]MDE1833984.1 50S ribosomal protein L2 [Candidatus Micrarchaeota archaeon]MDE1858965.1 50S ribosomal protein L2 [Candidatus Micrarchaeota archaeon]
MGKRLKMQRRGKGSNAYRKPPNTFKADVTFRGKQIEGRSYAEVVRFVDDPGHTGPLMVVKYDDFTENTLLAPEGIKIGDRIEEGKQASVTLGSILPLRSIPDGMLVYNIEMRPGDGGKVARVAGSYATIKSHIGDTVSVFLPSKKSVDLSGECRAEIGAVAGGGINAQPLMKAGKAHYIWHATNAKWPKNRGVKSNPVDHPFGGKQHHKGKSSMTSRNAPPGRKVGHIAARRVGRRKSG